MGKDTGRPRDCTLSNSAIVDLWQEARQAAGLELLTQAQLKDRSPFMREFFSHHGGGVMVPNPELYLGAGRVGGGRLDTIVGAYIPILKAANNMLHLNLRIPRTAGFRISGEPRNSPVRYQFTLARDPFSHFASGYTEAAWRTMIDGACPRYAPLLCRAVGVAAHQASSRTDAERIASGSDSERIVGAILDARKYQAGACTKHGGCEPASGFFQDHGQHMYVQMGIMRAGWRLDYVGHLENMQQSWDELWHAVPGYDREAAAPPLDLHVGEHASSSDPLGHRRELYAYLEAHPTLHEALCILLRPDYRCLGYNESGCLAAVRSVSPSKRVRRKVAVLNRSHYGDMPVPVTPPFDHAAMKTLRASRCNDGKLMALLRMSGVSDPCARSMWSSSHSSRISRAASRPG